VPDRVPFGVVTYDAIVIGAGLSGLVCARRLVERGLRVLVVEARERVGGRLLTGEVAGRPVDLGGQWITAGQDRAVSLAAELDIATYEHVRAGQPIVDEPGGLVTRVAAAFAQRRALRSIDSLMRSIPPGDAAAAPRAAVLDRMSLASWLDEVVKNELARERIRVHADLVFAADPADLSLLSYLSILGATGGFLPQGPDLPGGGREHFVEGGAQSLVTSLYDRTASVIELRLREPVIAIADTGGAATVRTELGAYSAQRVVLAIPPGLVRGIAVELPPPHRAYVDSVRAGPVVKCFAAYDRAFWRDRGLSGEAYLPRGLVRATVELHAGQPVLLAFVVGPHAAGWADRPPDQRRADVLAILAARFGDDAAAPVDFVEHDWAAERFSAGCVAATPPGVLARGARWREAHGRIHIAGTESAIHWPGYMDGAIEAGERAAAEVVSATA
jgi:monoamine oxidase